MRPHSPQGGESLLRRNVCHVGVARRAVIRGSWQLHDAVTIAVAIRADATGGVVAVDECHDAGANRETKMHDARVGRNQGSRTRQKCRRFDQRKTPHGIMIGQRFAREQARQFEPPQILIRAAEDENFRFEILRR